MPTVPDTPGYTKGGASRLVTNPRKGIAGKRKIKYSDLSRDALNGEKK